MRCNIINIRETDGTIIKGFIISDPSSDYYLIVDEHHTVRFMEDIEFYYTKDRELKF